MAFRVCAFARRQFVRDLGRVHESIAAFPAPPPPLATCAESPVAPQIVQELKTRLSVMRALAKKRVTYDVAQQFQRRVREVRCCHPRAPLAALSVARVWVRADGGRTSGQRVRVCHASAAVLTGARVRLHERLQRL